MNISVIQSHSMMSSKSDMTSQVFGEVVGISLEEDECRECEHDNHTPHKPRVHRNTKHSGL